MLFELPYNFNKDGQYFECLNKYKNMFKYIKFIYLPCFFSGPIQNTRLELTKNELPKTIEEWESHIERLKETGIDICILIQRYATIEMIEELIEKYDIHIFTINDDELAKNLKSKYGDKIQLNLSITRVLTYDDILNTDLSMYDNIVLFFYFNRHLNLIKKLPTKYNYSLIVNTHCLWNCKMHDKHWFDGANFNGDLYCNTLKIKNRQLCMKNVGYIRPEDLKFFERYLGSYKLEGREFSSQHIFSIFKTYLLKESTLNYDGFDEDNVDLNYNLN